MNDISTIYRLISLHYSDIDLKLKIAGMPDTKDEFIKKTFLTAGYMSLAIFLVIFLFLSKLPLKTKFIMIIIGLPLLFFILFSYFMKIPDIKIKALEKEINKEIIFAGRFLVIEIESGVSLYQTMINIGNSYEVVGEYFREIIEKIKVGTTMEAALNEAAEMVPSGNLRKIMWQILNSLKTGSDISVSINSVIEQVIREQQIEVKEYGRKLNPLAMFYMMVAVIIPSLGMTMLVVLATFMGIQLGLGVLLLIVVMLGLIQFMFVAIIRSSRPPVDF